MKLHDYLKKEISSSNNKAEKKKELARMFGVSASSINSWANGWRYPGRKTWDKIIKATDGQVSLDDLAWDEKAA